MDFEQVAGGLEETGAGPVGRDVRIGRGGEERSLAVVLRGVAGRQESDEPVGRCPVRGMGVEQQPLAGRLGRGKRGGELIERAVVELCRDFDEARNAGLNRPSR